LSDCAVKETNVVPRGVLAESLGVHIDVDQVDLEPNLLGLNEQQYDSIYLFNDDDRKSFEEIAGLIEESSDLPCHDPRESTAEHGVSAITKLRSSR
jgi:hypothetical protein